MAETKLRTPASPARALRVAELRRLSRESGLSHEQQGQLIGTDGKGVRRLLAHGRKRADRYDLFRALSEVCLANQQRFRTPMGVAVLLTPQAAPARDCAGGPANCLGNSVQCGVSVWGGADVGVAKEAA